MIKSELSVAFTGWGDDIDKTDNPGAKEKALKTSAYGQMPPHLFNSRKTPGMYNSSQINILFNQNMILFLM